MDYINYMNYILVTSGEPGGIGPDICLDLANHIFENHTIIVLGDVELLEARAKILNKELSFTPLLPTQLNPNNPKNDIINKKGNLLVLHMQCPNRDTIGKLLTENAVYVLQMLDLAIMLCKQNIAHTIVTLPISKEIINKALVYSARSCIDLPDIAPDVHLVYGVAHQKPQFATALSMLYNDRPQITHFSGHTEYFAQAFGCKKVVMMLATTKMKVALLTTHIPLADVVKYITQDNISQTVQIIHDVFQKQYKIANPKIAICGLNPHAGEGGYIGREEVDVVNPTINKMQQSGIDVSGCYSADTIFNRADEFDVILAMYHDQGLPVLKYSGFEEGINVTLGLPIIRTSVDHGTALALAGTGRASSLSLINAVNFAINFV
jgi:4-hydroxythreonine-4-phosphate dehydrogenase